MNKQILALIFVSVRVLSFSEEIPLDIDMRSGQSLECFTYGTMHLLSHEPSVALEYFEKGRHVAQQIHSSAHEFCVTFAEAVALDCLGKQEQCAQAIQSLYQFMEMEDVEEDDLSAVAPFYSQRTWPCIEFFSNLSSIAPSLQVREVLFSIVERMAEELQPSFQWADPLYLEEAEWSFDYESNEDYSLQLCKKNHHHKKEKKNKWEKVNEWAERILRFFKYIKEAKKLYDEFKN